MSDINRGAERKVRIPDSWYGEEPDKATEKFYYLEPDTNDGTVEPISHDVQNFIPAGIKVGIHASDTSKQQTSTITMATVRGWLHGETQAQIDNHEIVIGPMEPIRFKAISSRQTDGRKIVIYGF